MGCLNSKPARGACVAGLEFKQPMAGLGWFPPKEPPRAPPLNLRPPPPRNLPNWGGGRRFRGGARGGSFGGNQPRPAMGCLNSKPATHAPRAAAGRGQVSADPPPHTPHPRSAPTRPPARPGPTAPPAASRAAPTRPRLGSLRSFGLAQRPSRSDLRHLPGILPPWQPGRGGGPASLPGATRSGPSRGGAETRGIPSQQPPAPPNPQPHQLAANSSGPPQKELAPGAWGSSSSTPSSTLYAGISADEWCKTDSPRTRGVSFTPLVGGNPRIEGGRGSGAARAPSAGS